MWCLLPPGLYFSIKNGSIWPAWPDIPSGAERCHSPRTSILTVVQKTCFSGTSFFWYFSQICSPKWLPKVQKPWHLKLQDDAMSLFRCIFGRPVFERPYSDSSLFSYVSGTRKLKKTCEKALKTFLATHRKKHTHTHTHLEITPGSENVQKSTQTGGPNGRLAAATGVSSSPGWPFGWHMGTQILKNTFRAWHFMQKSSKCTFSKLSK